MENFNGMVIDGPLGEQLKKKIERIARYDITVLIIGETGTGKELVAKAIHDLSSRKDCSFVKINCAAIPSTLLETELFGSKKGAFTGAVDKSGKFALAEKGTIFLDEVAEIPFDVQSKLLEVTESGKFFRLGEEKETKVDVRIVAATNKDIAVQIATGKFREDLYFRLAPVVISVPPLRERKIEIVALARYFLEFYSQKFQVSLSLSGESLEVLEEYHWPGNIRELENTIIALLVENEKVVMERLQKEIMKKSQNASDRSWIKTLEIQENVLKALEERKEIPLKEAAKEAARMVERFLIVKALNVTQWHIGNAAKLLEVAALTVQNHMEELGIERRWRRRKGSKTAK